MTEVKCLLCTKLLPIDDMATANICKRCDVRLFRMIHDFTPENEALPPSGELLTGEGNEFESYLLDIKPKDVKSYLDKYVVGQEEVKKALSVLIVNHMFMVFNNLQPNHMKIKRSVLMITGPTGSGKTLSIQKTAELYDIPFVSIDCTTLTAAGYVGQNVEDVFLDTVLEHQNQPNWDGNMIVYFDEIDKIVSNESARGKDVNGKAVQQALLKIIEGIEVKIDMDYMGRKQTIPFNTENVLFILSGAFTDLREKLDRKAKEAPVGFGSKKTRNHYKITSKDLIKSGMIRELIGRVSHIIEAKELTKKELKQILTEPEDSILKQYDLLCGLRNLDKISDKLDLDQIVKLAVKRKVGARGLRNIIEEQIQDHMYNEAKN